MYENPEIDIPTKTSKYNTAVDQMYRFGEIWRDTYQKAKAGDFVVWNLTLDGVWRELAGDLKKHSDDEKEMNAFNIILAKLYPLQTPISTSFNKREEIDLLRVSKQYHILTQKEIFLRRLQNRLGKGTVLVDADEDDFD